MKALWTEVIKVILDIVGEFYRTLYKKKNIF